MYVGRIFSIGTYNMDVLMVAWFSNARSTGYYCVWPGRSPASWALPMLGWRPRSSLAWRASMRSKRAGSSLPGQWAALGVLVVVFVVPPLVVLVFGKDYSPVGPLAIPLVIATDSARSHHLLQHLHVCPRTRA